MPEYKGGSFRQWLLAGAPDSQKRQRLIQLLQAVERIHASGVTHNDMKLENVLLTEGAEDAVLSDFELSHTTGGAIQLLSECDCLICPDATVFPLSFTKLPLNPPCSSTKLPLNFPDQAHQLTWRQSASPRRMLSRLLPLICTRSE